MWICDSCRNVNADDAAYCFGCGDMGPLGEEIRRKAAQRPGEQLVWLLAVAIVLIWTLALLVPKVIETGRAPEASTSTTPSPYTTQAPPPESDVAVHILLIAVTTVVGVLALIYLIWLGVWISKRRREHKALVDTED